MNLFRHHLQEFYMLPKSEGLTRVYFIPWYYTLGIMPRFLVKIFNISGLKKRV